MRFRDLYRRPDDDEPVEMFTEWPVEAVREILAHGCRYGPFGSDVGSFYNCMMHAFGVQWNPDGWWVYPRVHRFMCNTIERWARESFAAYKSGASHPGDIMVIVLRNGGKSVAINRTGTGWFWLQDPEFSILLDGSDAQNGVEFLEATKQTISGEDGYALWTWLYGDDWKKPGRTWKTEKLVHGHRKSTAKAEPSVMVTSVESGATGKHPDIRINDDPIEFTKIDEYGEARWLDKCHNHERSMRYVVKWLTLQVGTRYHDDDVLGRGIAREGVREWAGHPPVDPITPREDGRWRVFMLDAIDEDGMFGTPNGATIPTYWPLQKLKEAERQDPVGFYAQMRQRPGVTLSGGLTQKQIQRLLVDQRPGVNDSVLSIHMDTAFKEGRVRRIGDESVLQVWAHTMSGLEIVYLWGKGSTHFTAEQFTDLVVSTTATWLNLGYHIRCLTDEMETGGKGGVWRMALRQRFMRRGVPMPPLITLNRWPGDGQQHKKATRISNALLFWGEGELSTVKLLRGAEGLAKLIHQAQKWRSGRKDWIDCGADAVDPRVRLGYRPGEVSEAEDLEHGTSHQLRAVNSLDDYAIQDYLSLRDNRRTERDEWLRDPV